MFDPPGGMPSQTFAVTVCVAKISAYSKDAEPSEEIQFLADSDSALGKRLREVGKVGLAVIEPYKHESTRCTLSEFKKVEGKSPQGTRYFIEGVLLRWN